MLLSLASSRLPRMPAGALSTVEVDSGTSGNTLAFSLPASASCDASAASNREGTRIAAVRRRLKGNCMNLPLDGGRGITAQTPRSGKHGPGPGTRQGRARELFVAQGVYGRQIRCLAGRQDAEDHADQHGKQRGAHYGPPGNRGWGKVRNQRGHAIGQPEAEQHADDAA